MGSYYEINIFFSSLFFVAFPIAVTQVSSNVEGDKMSVTRAPGTAVSFTCALTQNTNYIHVYTKKEGTAPHAFSTTTSTTQNLRWNQEIVQRNIVFMQAQARAIHSPCYIWKNVTPAHTTVLSGTSTLVHTSFPPHWKFWLWQSKQT